MGDVAVRNDAIELNIEDVKAYVCKGADDKELFYFLNISKSFNLNPFKREVYWIKYGNNPASVVVGYETYLKRAERTGLLDGWDVAIGKDDNGQFATITIHRKDRSRPFSWTVYRAEVDTGQALWKRMPTFMLRKVAISQGFRLAFPEELGGLPYIPEEINGITSEQLPTNVIDTHAIKPDLRTHEDTFEQIKSDITNINNAPAVREYAKRWAKEINAHPRRSELVELGKARIAELEAEENNESLS